MSGNINLYRPELLPQPVELSLFAILKIQACVIAALIALGSAQQWQTRHFQKALLAAATEQKQAEKQLEDYGLRYPPIHTDPDLQNRIDDTERTLRGKNRMLRLVEGGKQQKSAGFARFLAGFSRQHVPGLWLESIQVETRGDLYLAGSVTDASMLPIYLERLSGDSAFSDYHFQTFRVAQPGQLTPQVGQPDATTAPAATETETPLPSAIPGALHFELRATSKQQTAPIKFHGNRP